MSSNSNRGVVYLKPGSVEVQRIDFPTFRNPAGKTIDHGVILKVVTTNICGSDQHMVRGRTTAPAGMVLGHEITGEVIEKGSDVEMIEVGDLVKLPKGIEHAWRHFGDEPIGFLCDVVPAGFETFFAATEAANLTEDDIPGRSRIALQFGIEITGPGLSDKNVQDILRSRHPPAEEIGL